MNQIRVVIVACLSTMVGPMPAYQLGATAVLMPGAFGLNPARLGIATAVFFACSALASVPGGRLADRVGGPLGIRLAAALSVVACLGITRAGHYQELVMWMSLAGVANGVAQPSGNVAIRRHVTGSRFGLAFGIKQAAVPMAVFAAGAAVPALAVPLGWRPAFLVAVVPGLLVFVMAPWARESRPGDPSSPGRRGFAGRALALLTAAAALGAAANTALGTFFVPSATAHGISPAVAGLLVSLASAGGIAARILAGALADRRPGQEFTLVTGMLAGGAVGVLGLTFAAPVPLVALAALVAYGIGWSWQGLMAHGVATLHPRHAGAATGMIHAGLFLGGATGPFGFGWLATAHGYGVAWAGSVAILLTAAALVRLSHRHTTGHAEPAPETSSPASSNGR
ncbi:MFS transporter [Nonomuraea sp. NN258]|uniref:MFS transporter n=1 Tax=Nonomuraea antri TaxID=2730852 RepID=UPI001568BC8C|nr:MFS transporter [Nonomuraea antri]NRQ39774.1 MFS transporter [Nonomuraea antri]